jgi:uncharacterized protein (TIGR00290 family)
MREKIVFCWSGGKDSALALNRLRQEDRYEVVSLLTTCNEHFQRVSMHGVRLELLERQARSIGLPLEKIFLSRRSSNQEYEQKMSACLLAHQARGVVGCGFGDIFLEDLKRWREQNLERAGLRGVFPIWKVPTPDLIRELVATGLGTIICCVNDAYLDETFLGRVIDPELVAALPPGVDPCGENGEFHSFAFAGPIFREPVQFKVGEKVYRPLEETHPTDSNSPPPPPSTAPRPTKGFWFCDLLP